MKKALENLLQSRMIEQDLQRDPLSFVHRYEHPHDQEIAGLFASQLAYGRVSLFLPVLKKFFDIVILRSVIILLFTRSSMKK